MKRRRGKAAALKVPLRMISNGDAIVDGQSLETPMIESPVPEIAAPVVFQCCRCKSIVGDSSTIAQMDSEQRTMSIKRKVESIEVDPTLHTSTREYDFGSNYHFFSCSACKNIIGQVYRTTSAKMDHMRDLFTYHSDQLSFYQLYPDPDVAGAPVMEDETEVSGEVTPGKALQTGTITGPTVTNAPLFKNDIEVEVIKLQKFCLFLLDRVQKLEEQAKKS